MNSIDANTNKRFIYYLVINHGRYDLTSKLTVVKNSPSLNYRKQHIKVWDQVLKEGSNVYTTIKLHFTFKKTLFL